MPFQRLSSQLAVGIIGTPLLLWGILQWYGKPVSTLYAPTELNKPLLTGSLLDASGGSLGQ